MVMIMKRIAIEFSQSHLIMYVCLIGPLSLKFVLHFEKNINTF
jgi:hypothetical protein